VLNLPLYCDIENQLNRLCKSNLKNNNVVVSFTSRSCKLLFTTINLIIVEIIINKLITIHKVVVTFVIIQFYNVST
jgi:hypothetical protein